MHHHLLLRVVAKLLISTIILFAFYVQFHGDFSPGGGFQAGVIMASAFIFYGLVFGLDKAKIVFPPWLVHKLAALGVLIFAGLTAYDTQNIKNTYLAHAHHGDQEWLQKSGIMGALSLYLNFINMFMMLLQLFGNRE